MAVWNNSAFDRVLVNEEDSKRFYNEYKTGEFFRENLVKVLDGKICLSELDAENKEGYSVNNWAFKQADLIGYRRALKELRYLLSIDTTDNTSE